MRIFDNTEISNPHPLPLAPGGAKPQIHFGSGGEGGMVPLQIWDIGGESMRNRTDIQSKVTPINSEIVEVLLDIRDIEFQSLEIVKGIKSQIIELEARVKALEEVRKA